MAEPNEPVLHEELSTTVQRLDRNISDIRADIHGMEHRVTALEIGQKWLIWGVGITLAMVMGNFAVTIAMALHMLTQKF